MRYKKLERSKTADSNKKDADCWIERSRNDNLYIDF